MDAGLRAVREALSRAGMVVEPHMQETHISWVLLSGDRAYKVKKPVRFPFVDYSSAERRALFVRRELELGRRMTPELYLEVLEARGDPPRFHAGGPLVEAALAMRRFPEDAVLANRADLLTAPMIEALADEVARVHREAPVLAPDAARVRVRHVKTGMEEDFAELKTLAGSEAARRRFAHLHVWCAHELAVTNPLRRERADAGHVRELHGDLHLRNIVWLDGRPRLFDPIEFNDDFRLIDTAADLAFLAMDLMARGHDEHAQTLLARYVDVTQDARLLEIIRFHLVQRALVRAKVALIQSDGATVARYVALAERLIAPAEAPQAPAHTGARSTPRAARPSPAR